MAIRNQVTKKSREGGSYTFPGLSLYSCQTAAGTGQFLEGAAADRGAQRREGLDALNVGPLTPRNGIEPQNSAGLPLGFQQRLHSAGLIHGFCV